MYMVSPPSPEDADRGSSNPTTPNRMMVRGGSQGSPPHLQSTPPLCGQQGAAVTTAAAHAEEEPRSVCWFWVWNTFMNSSAGWEVSWPADRKCSVIRRLMDKNWCWSQFDNSSEDAQKQLLSFIIIIALLLFSSLIGLLLSLCDYPSLIWLFSLLNLDKIWRFTESQSDC